MNIIETIKAEVERLKEKYTNMMPSIQKCSVCDELLSFLDILKEQLVCDGLEEEIERYLHSLGVGYGGWVDGMEDDDLRGIARHFAQWQKEQMMKEAVEGIVYQPCDHYFPQVCSGLPFGMEAKHGDKVKLIIIKED